MSDGDRGPQGKAATQDPYAKAADAAARSRTARNGSGPLIGPNGNRASTGSGQSNGAPRSTPATKPGAVSTSDTPAVSPRPGPAATSADSAAKVSGAPANAGAVPQKAAPVEPAGPRPGEAPRAAHAEAAGGSTTEKPAVSWKDKLSALTHRVAGTDPTEASTSDADPTTAARTSSNDKPAKDRSAKRASAQKSTADEPTAVVAATPVPATGAARVTGTRTAAVPAAAGTAAVAAKSAAPEAEKHKSGTARRTRKARLRLSRLDPWSVMKTAFMFSIAGGIMLVVGVYAIWTVISGSGLFDNVNEIIASVVSTPGDTTPFRVEDYINTAKVMGVTAFLACIDVVIFTALATLGSFLYNLAATMLGGLEITLAED